MEKIYTEDIQEEIEKVQKILEGHSYVSKLVGNRLESIGFSLEDLGTGASARIKSKEIKVMIINSYKYLKGKYLVVGKNSRVSNKDKYVYRGFVKKIYGLKDEMMSLLSNRDNVIFWNVNLYNFKKIGYSDEEIYKIRLIFTALMEGWNYAWDIGGNSISKAIGKGCLLTDKTDYLVNINIHERTKIAYTGVSHDIYIWDLREAFEKLLK